MSFLPVCLHFCTCICISILIGKKCSLGFPVERYCLVSLPPGLEQLGDQRKENRFPSLRGLKLWVLALSDRCCRASLRNSAFLRACPPQLQRLLPHPVLPPPPSVSYCRPHSEQEEVWLAAAPAPRTGPGCLSCGLSPQNISGGPGGMIALGSRSWSVLPICEGRSPPLERSSALLAPLLSPE